MPVRTWKKDGKWYAKWGSRGKTYSSKDKATAVRRAKKQGQAAHASGYKKK